MKRDEDNLGGLFDSIGYFGEISPVWGALVGAALSEGGILVARSMKLSSPKMAKYAGAVGLAAGGIPALVGLFFPSLRRASYLALAVTAINGIAELIRGQYVDLQGTDGIGLYEVDMAGLGAQPGIDILGAAPSVQILGQSTPEEAMAGLGMYQSEMAGYAPLQVSGGGLFSGQF